MLIYWISFPFVATTNDGDSNISQFTSVLTLMEVDDAVEGKYQCIISNHLGSVHSRKAQITVYGKEDQISSVLVNI